MAAEGGVHEARQVSETFVQQYYRIIGTSTDAAHKLYVDASLVTRPGPDGTMLSFTSLEAIKEHYLTSYYDGATFDLLSVDTQSSLGHGVFIMVIGFLTGKDNLKRKFSQTFYLTPQNSGHVVVNDIYRFVDEDSSTPTTLPAAESVSEVAKPLEEVKKTAQVHKGVAPTKKSVKKVVAGATLEKAVAPQKPKEAVAETATPPLDTAKISYASMVQSMSRNAAPLKAAAPVQKPKSMAQPSPRAAPAPSVGKPEKKSDHKMVDEPGTSIFVSNLPMDAMPPQVYELFKGFGPIKENGVQIRSSRASGRCFGFVAFESTASVQSVLKAAKSKPFKLGEHKLRVKEKQVEYYGGKSSIGRSGSGSKSQNGSVNGSKTECVSVDGSKTESGSVDGSKTENGSVAGEEDGEFTLVTRRKNRREKR